MLASISLHSQSYRNDCQPRIVTMATVRKPNSVFRFPENFFLVRYLEITSYEVRYLEITS